MRLRCRFLLLFGLLGVSLTILPPLASSATTATVEALNEPGAGLYSEERHYWSPQQAAVTTAGGVVTFANNSSTVPHGIVWKSTPATPNCETGTGKVPVGLGHSGTSWHGACTFTQAGTYTYYCSVHGESMSGTIYVNASGTLPPLATTETASALSETGATLRGAVNPQGQPTSYYFNYGLSTSYGQKTAELPAGTDSSSHPESAAVTGLTPGTTYHYQLAATYASGASTVLGADQTFTTISAPGAPTAATAPASALSETSATLNGSVNPGGQTSTYFFNYGLTNNYGQSTSIQSTGAGSSAQAVSAVLAGLAPGTTYHYQLVAHNTSGNAPGDDMTFTTSSPAPPPPTHTNEPPPSPIVSPPASIALAPSVTVPPGPGPTTGKSAPSGSPLAGTAASAIKLASTQQGAAVRGTLNVSPAGAGGRLEVDLLAASASLARAHHSAPVLVGRLVHTALTAGKVSFTVSLSAQGKRALRRHTHLPLIVKLTLTAPAGTTVTTTRSLLLRR